MAWLWVVVKLGWMGEWQGAKWREVVTVWGWVEGMRWVLSDMAYSEELTWAVVTVYVLLTVNHHVLLLTLILQNGILWPTRMLLTGYASLTQPLSDY